MVFNAALFDQHTIEPVAHALGFDIDDQKHLLLGGEQVKCRACGNDITTSNVANISKGSLLTYCDNPACYAFRSGDRR